MSTDPHSFDQAKLANYLEQQIEGFKGPLTAEKFPKGQSNPTFAITTQSQRYVLRRKPPGKLLKSAHAVDREFRVLQALAATDVPVAKAYHLCEDDSIIGSMFYLMEYVEASVYWDATLPALNNEQRGNIYNEMNRVLAALHSVNVDKVGLSDYGKPGNYFDRQLDRWHKQYRASETETITAMEQLISWLQANKPANDGRVSLVHGDFRLDNMMFNPDTQQVKALVDWELSTLGHPFADLAYQCMQLRLAADGALKGLGGVDRATLGIPSEENYVALYCQRMGIEKIDHWNFYLAFSFFRLAAILQGVKKRALDGNASSKKALEVAAMVRPLAEAAIELIT